MDFIVGLPWTQRKFNAVWVIVDKLTKLVHFIPIAVPYSSEQLAEIYIWEIVHLHGVPVSSISDRERRTVRAYNSDFEVYAPSMCYRLWSFLGSVISINRIFLQQQLLVKHLDAPYEALYGRQYRSPVGWFESVEARLLGTNLLHDALDKIKIIQDRLRTAQSRKKRYGNHKVCDVAFMVGQRVLPRMSPMKDRDEIWEEGKVKP
ncbi:uncharacterized protein [Nicotiana sylvestris]|uniref:uncharacterized protein n=1 Tax=Nicotiana sylvestris TaxID=4096 RepID=UPI00388CAA59